jgi:hypothetical protein
LALILLISSAAVLADGKGEAVQEWQHLRSLSPQKQVDPAVAQKAAAEAEVAAKLQAEIALQQHPANEVLAVEAKTAPERGARPVFDPRVSVLLTEGFESGAVPPAGWSDVITNPGATFHWYPGSYTFEGFYSAEVLYDPALVPQDEWLISPILDFTSVTADIRVDFYWDMSYYWGVDPFDNYDLELRISTDGGSTFPTLLWDESGEGVFGNYVYYHEVVSLAAYMGENDVVLAWRYVGVDGAQANVDFINVTDDAPPVLGPGDNCTDPLKIELPSELPYADGNTTCGRANDYSGTCLSPYDGGEDIVYEITVTSPVTVNITLNPLGTSWTGMVVDDMCPPDGSCLATDNNGGSSTPYSIQSLALAPGTYYLMIDTWPSPDCVPDFDLFIEEAAPPQPGDNCSDPLKIDLPPLPYSDLGQTTCGRIDNYSSTCLNPYDLGEDIIYEVTVTSEVTVDITLDPLGTDYTGILIDDACPPDFSCIDYSYNFGTTPHGMTSLVLSPGTYYIMVDTWPAPDCIPSFDLHITEGAPPPPPPANDDWANAEPVSDVTDLPFCTDAATFDGPYACNQCPNVWYCYTATCDGNATAELCGSTFDTRLDVYNGCGEPTLGNWITCNDDFCGLQSTIEFPVLAGQTYLIEVGGYGSGPGCNVGCGDLTISCALACQVECPGGSTDEGEPCGDDTNGGCNSFPPVFRTITCGETVCGTGWYDGFTRDTDWYLLTLDGYYDVTWTVQAEFEALIGPVATGTPGSGVCEDVLGYIDPAGFPLECEVGSVTFLAGPGSYMLFVAPLFASNVLCPGDYWANVTCVPAEPEYCGASSNICDEYISNVTVGSINNSSGCSNYADYTALSTSMDIGTAYPISVSNGFPYIEDQCGIWVDWNQDADFFDTDETIAVSGTPGNGPYTGSITPPAGALAGPTRLRVRITWIGAVSPCGVTTYGEVEDYTVNVEGGGPAPFEMSLDPDPIYAAMARPLEPHCVDIYVCGEISPGYGPEDVNLSTLMVNGSLSPVSSEVLVPPNPICEGPVLHICVDMATFVQYYGILYNTTMQSCGVSGEMDDTSPFAVGDDFTYIGHISGDVNLDGTVNILDLNYLIRFIFRGGPVPGDPVEADINADGNSANIIDLNYFVNYVFRGGPGPLKLE